jgi:protein arginine N-methyltransferase 5
MYLASPHSALYWINVPLVATLPPTAADAESLADGADGGGAGGVAVEHDTWEWWNKLRTLVGPTAKLAVALELTADLPPPSAIARWLGEPVRGVIVPTSIFLTNKKGYPVLSKAHQVRVLGASGEVALMSTPRTRHVHPCDTHGLSNATLTPAPTSTFS